MPHCRSGGHGHGIEAAVGDGHLFLVFILHVHFEGVQQSEEITTKGTDANLPHPHLFLGHWLLSLFFLSWPSSLLQ